MTIAPPRPQHSEGGAPFLDSPLPYLPPPWTEPYQWRVTVVNCHTGELLYDYGLMGENEVVKLADLICGCVRVTPSFSFPHSHGGADSSWT